MNVSDTVVIVCAFVLCLAEFTAAPIVALRGLRILRRRRGVRGACRRRASARARCAGWCAELASRGATLMVFMRRPFASFVLPHGAGSNSSLVASTRRLDGAELRRRRADRLDRCAEVAVTHRAGPRRAPRARGRPRAAPGLDGRRRRRAPWPRPWAAVEAPRGPRRPTATGSSPVWPPCRGSREVLGGRGRGGHGARRLPRGALGRARRDAAAAVARVLAGGAPGGQEGPPRDTDGLLAAAPRVNPMHTTS